MSALNYGPADQTRLQSLPREAPNPVAPSDPPSGNLAFSAAETAAVYRAIHERRDMRHFCGGEVPEAQRARLLAAAHHAPSVGFMQPWRFVRITDAAVRQQLHAIVEAERLETARALGERGDDFMALKVQGILDAAEVIVAGLMDRREEHVFGRRTLPEMDVASLSCAIQNLWLAARAEGLGMGWVSLFAVEPVRALLGMPPGAKPLAILCLGPVTAFYPQPMLQQEGWASRADLNRCIAENRWPE